MCIRDKNRRSERSPRLTFSEHGSPRPSPFALRRPSGSGVLFGNVKAKAVPSPDQIRDDAEAPFGASPSDHLRGEKPRIAVKEHEACEGLADHRVAPRLGEKRQAGSLQSVREQIPPESGPVPLRDADAYAPYVGHGFEQPQALERRHRRVVFERDAREERSEPLEPSFRGPRRIERRRQELRAPRIERRSGLAQRPAQGFEPARAERALFREVRKIARGSLEDLERPGDAGKKRVLESQVQARTAAASHRLEIGKGPPRLGDEPLCDRGPIEALDEERRGPGEPFARAQALHRLVEKQAAVLERLVRKATRHRARVTRRAGIALQPLLEREAHAPPRPREAACKKSAPGDAEGGASQRALPPLLALQARLRLLRVSASGSLREVAPVKRCGARRAPTARRDSGERE